MAQTLTQLGKFFRPTIQGADEIIAIRKDKDARDIYRGHKWLVSCERFCERGIRWRLNPTITQRHLTILRQC